MLPRGCEQNAFRDELLHQSKSVGSHGRSNSHLSNSGCCTCDLQMRNIDAGNQQQKTNRTKKHPQCRTYVPRTAA